MIPTVDLSSNDAHVLTALFDPEAAPTSSLTVDPSLAPYPSISPPTLSTLRAAEATAIRPLNVPHPSTAALQEAISSLSDILSKEPGYASAYANRAQARRLLLGDALYTRETAEDTTALFTDLELCIAHAAPASPASPLSPHQAQLLAAAHTHRGYLFMKASSLAFSGELVYGPPEVCGQTREELEERASKEFFLGGRYGERKAREMSVRTNPYAKMCGAIVKEAMRKEREEYMGVA